MKDNARKFIYLFLVLSPIIDIVSSIANHYKWEFSPSIILRLIIPLGLIIYIFIKDKKVRLPLVFVSIIYTVYGLIHLYVYQGLITDFSYGTIIHEAQYIVNYTYMVFSLFLFGYLFYNNKEKIIRYLLIFNVVYLASIYLAYVTNTSLTSYVEGVGIKGWFYTSGAVGAVLVLSSFAILPYLLFKDIPKRYKIMYLVALYFYLINLIGSRVGMYGSIISIISFVILLLIFKGKEFIKKHIFYITGAVIAIVLFIVAFGSYTLERRQMLKQQVNPGINIAIHLNDERININNIYNKDYLLPEQKESLNELYDFATYKKLANNDLRSQQLIYHNFLYDNQNSIILKLFGNGYLTNHPTLTLEMETFAMLFNFGIIGFILYLGPFLATTGLGLYYLVKKRTQVDLEYMMYLAGIFTSYLISTLAGHVYFNTSVMPVVIILHILLLNKIFVLRKK